MQNLHLETGYKIPKIDRVKVRYKNSAPGNWMQNTLNRLHQAKMQKFCIWETAYKIPKTDCIKLRCKNSASGKLNTNYLKLTASIYSLSQNCRDTFVSSRSPNVGVHDLVTESQ